MLVPGILIPCHQPCAMAGSALISAMWANGISSELLKAHSLSAPRTWRTRLPPEMDKSTIVIASISWCCAHRHQDTCSTFILIRVPLPHLETMSLGRAREPFDASWLKIRNREYTG